MIDLRNKNLQKSIEVQGKYFLIETDFRFWLDFDKIKSNKEIKIVDLIKYFPKEVPYEDMQSAFYELCKFYTNKNSTPHSSETHGSEKILDYIEDGEYIVGSFLETYGIDLTSCDMHWHMFQALFRCLPDDSKIKTIMMFRGWHKDNTSTEVRYNKAKNAWRLDNESNESTINDELISEINNQFYNC